MASTNALLQACLSTDTTLTVTGPILNVKSPGCVKIESEVIRFTAATDTQYLGCTRGYAGSTAAAHAVGKSVIGTSDSPDTFRLIGVHEDVTAVTIFTPPVSGMYHVAIYCVATAGVDSDTVPQTTLLGWTDESTSQQVYFSNWPGSGNATLYALGSYDLVCLAGTPITWSTSGGTYTSAVWNMHFSVTKI